MKKIITLAFLLLTSHLHAQNETYFIAENFNGKNANAIHIFKLDGSKLYLVNPEKITKTSTVFKFKTDPLSSKSNYTFFNFELSKDNTFSCEMCNESDKIGFSCTITHECLPNREAYFLPISQSQLEEVETALKERRATNVSPADY